MSTLGDRILKVNHAGEHGAVAIYNGQMFMARFTATGMHAQLAEFREHENSHRDIFAAELQRRNVDRCRSYNLCGFGGLVLGLLTGLLGKSAISATTAAVESVVLRHLEHQIAALENADPEAVAAIRAIIIDEQLHHDASARQGNVRSVWSRLITPVVAFSTEAVIWLGMSI